MRLQLTLAIIKPDVCVNSSRLQFVRRLLVKNGFLVVRSKKMLLDLKQAEMFYQMHKDKFFYNRLVSYMSSGMCYAHILARNDAIATWRRLMGPTKVSRAIHEAPRTIRGSIGLSDTRNSTHGSDSPHSASQEINFFFPQFNATDWYRTKESKFRRKHVIFDAINFLHRPIVQNKFA